MKLMVLLEIDVSSTLADTMQRSGFALTPDGTRFQIKIPNSPAIPQRKIKAVFVGDPTVAIEEVAKQCCVVKSDAVEPLDVSNGS
jgi:hypothetical protein